MLATPDLKSQGTLLQVVNVSGTRFEMSENTWAEIKKTMPEEARAEVKQTGSDVFLERHAGAFRSILYHHQGGELHLPADVCPSSFKAELAFYGVDEAVMAKCCFTKYVNFFDDQDVLKILEHDETEKSKETNKLVQMQARGGWEGIQAAVWLVLNEPFHSKTAKVYFAVSAIVVMASLFSLVAGTHQKFHRELTIYEWQEYFGTEWDKYAYFFLPYAEEKADPETAGEPETIAEPEKTVEPGTNSEPKISTKPEATAEPESNAESETPRELESDEGTDPENTSEPNTDAKPETTAEPETSAESETTGESEEEIEPKNTTQPKSNAKTETTAEPETFTEPETSVEPDTAGESESDGETETEFTTEAMTISEPETTEESGTSKESGRMGKPEGEMKQDTGQETTAGPESTVDPQSEDNANSKTEPETSAKPEAEGVTEPKTEPEKVAESETAAEPETTTGPETETTREPDTEDETYPVSTEDPENTEPETSNEPETSAESESTGEPETEGENEAKTEAEAHPVTTAKSGIAEPETSAESETNAEPESTSAPETTFSDSAGDSETGSGPKSEAEAEAEVPIPENAFARIEMIEYMEYICTAIFTVDLAIRVIFCPFKHQLLVSFLNWVDVFALTVVYIKYVVEALSPKEKYEASVLDIIHCLQVVRVFRLFRLVKNFTGFRVLMYAFKASFKEMLLMSLFLFIAMLLFATFAFFSGDDTFTSIPDSFWWAIVTMTTVGYGDVVPKTELSRFVGILCAICGVCLIAVIIPIFVNNFMLFYMYSKVWGKKYENDQLQTKPPEIMMSELPVDTFSKLQGKSEKYKF